MKQQERSNNDPAVMSATIVVANPDHTPLSSPTQKKKKHTKATRDKRSSEEEEEEEEAARDAREEERGREGGSEKLPNKQVLVRGRAWCGRERGRAGSGRAELQWVTRQFLPVHHWP